MKRRIRRNCDHEGILDVINDTVASRNSQNANVDKCGNAATYTKHHRSENLRRSPLGTLLSHVSITRNGVITTRLYHDAITCYSVPSNPRLFPREERLLNLLKAQKDSWVGIASITLILVLCCLRARILRISRGGVEKSDML